MESVEYGGWNCVRIVSDDVEALITVDVGPRVMRLGFIGGPNELHENEKDRGLKGGEDYRSYGGHRLWIAPEHAYTTYEPENEPVQYRQEDDWSVFQPAQDRWGMQKELKIRPVTGGFQLVHRIYNQGGYAARFAPWALTVMAAGGVCVFPQHRHMAHSENFLPVRPLVLWGYTEMDDPRYTFGKRVIRLQQRSEGNYQKIGALVQQGIAAYANHGNTFVKRFPHEPGAEYPDLGCNFETFTRSDMLEVESLGPLQTVAPGACATHSESWALFKDTAPPAGDNECGAWLEELGARVPRLA